MGLRDTIRISARRDESELVRELVAATGLSKVARATICRRAEHWVEELRHNTEPTLLESFLAEYGLSTQEGIALMCLAEALLRVPDTETIDELIADKLAASDWGAHSGKASSPLVNASTWALMLTGQVLSEADDEGLVSVLKDVLRRLGEPVVRAAVSQAMKELGQHFVLGEDIEDAIANARPAVGEGYTHSYDMLGEGARTDADANGYHLAYAEAITAIAKTCDGPVEDNAGISVKLSALHPRFEPAQQKRTFDTLLARTRSLAVLAAGSNMGFNIDAEESHRLDFTLDIVEALCAEPALADWEGFGVVVQAYGRRAAATIDWIAELARRSGRRIMVRLVKGAYWDSEIKRAQVLGIPTYPVFTRKAATDVSYIACARRLLDHGDRLYPQFATHNAHTVAAVLQLAGTRSDFEVQRLHGMGAGLHARVKDEHGVRSRIYAPVGVHRDLLAYLVRRLLENGANSSFVHQIVDESIPAARVARDPIDAMAGEPRATLPRPPAIFPGRVNSIGWDLDDPEDRAAVEAGLTGTAKLPNVPDTTAAEVERALATARAATDAWRGTTAAERAAALRAAADLLEQSAADLIALLTFEARKTRNDAVAELREAVDFLRYYAAEAQALDPARVPVGTVACISPWNFPLAIFTGQIAAALAAGNTVIAKPAEQTPAIAERAVACLHAGGVPASVLQAVYGPGETVGAQLSASPEIDGVCFTGSLDAAQHINRSLARPDTVLIAETGGINVMIVDSTALPEQAVRDVLSSAFQSAGQRCSALRMLYVQEDIAAPFLEMLTGAMDELVIGDPVDMSTDVGPVIDSEAHEDLHAYIVRQEIAHQIEAPAEGCYIPPTLIRVSGIEAVPREVFGPVLHYATFRADGLDHVLDAVNAKGYGLTGAIHTRLDDRVQHVIDRLHVGNLYVNRNQIGAVVESQPFGGEGLSGTGPKAGGPHYLLRLTRLPPHHAGTADDLNLQPIELPRTVLQDARVEADACDDLWPPDIARGAWPARQQPMASVTGESNVLSLHPRGLALCLGPDPVSARCQALQARWAGCQTVMYCPPGRNPLDAFGVAGIAALPTALSLSGLAELSVVAYCGNDELAHAYRAALAARSGAIVRLVTDLWDPLAYCIERHVSIDTTASGGNTTLLLAAVD